MRAGSSGNDKEEANSGKICEGLEKFWLPLHMTGAIIYVVFYGARKNPAQGEKIDRLLAFHKTGQAGRIQEVQP